MTYDGNNIFAQDPARRNSVPPRLRGCRRRRLHGRDAQADGHTLVVPKAASRNIFDADPAVLAKAIAVVQKLAVAGAGRPSPPTA